MIKVGVFGVGHLGKFHLNTWKNIEGAELIGFYDPNDEMAIQVEKEYKIKRYADAAELTAMADAVDIVAPTTHHFELTSMAIRKGKHVFVEKPLASTMEEAKEIVSLTREAGIKLQVGHIERFNPALLSLKGTQLNPMFIEVHRLAQFNPRGTEVSVILDLMIHDIDIILNMVNSDIRSISANGVAVMTDTPDIANVRIEFHNGCVANLTSSRISMKRMRKMRLFQKDAYIGIDFLEKKAEIIKMEPEPQKGQFTFDIETPGGKRTIAIANPVVPEENAMQLELQSFINSIRSNKPTAVGEMDGYRSMEVAHQIIQKIQRNQPVL